MKQVPCLTREAEKAERYDDPGSPDRGAEQIRSRIRDEGWRNMRYSCGNYLQGHDGDRVTTHGATTLSLY